MDIREVRREQADGGLGVVGASRAAEGHRRRRLYALIGSIPL